MKLLTNKAAVGRQAILSIVLFFSLSLRAASPYYYELKVYHFKTDAQEQRLDNYFQNAFIPAMHRLNFKEVGIFKPIKQDTADRRVYVFLSAKSRDQLEEIDQQLVKDQAYQAAGSDYINASFDDYPYKRIETIVLRAFRNMLEPALPQLTAPRAERIYELRSYENPSEKAGVSKIKMMNEGGEMGLFSQLGFNAVFYGKVIAGSRMPNVMYMTSFNTKDEREAHWNSFAPIPIGKSWWRRRNISTT